MTGLVGTADTHNNLLIDTTVDGISRTHLMPFGAQFLNARQGTQFRLWAPSAQSVTLVMEQASYRLHPQEQGWYELTLPEAAPGTLYQYRISQQNGSELLVPDPASRYQFKDVHGPSQVINPAEFSWQDSHWRGRPWEESVIYELHVGTFSPERSFQGVQNKLDYLADLGVTAIELMPIADFPGTRNWGYDGVLPYAPESRYGTPSELKELIQSAHARGMMVFLDVVYNHFGPEGNYLHAYANTFFDEQEHTPWGAAINFSGNHLPTSQTRSIREFFIHNALYWLEEYHFDGLRLDAVHAIADHSSQHFLDELAETIRNTFPQDRHIHLMLENNHNQGKFLKPPLYNAQWNDDFHHAAHVLLTGEKTGYYADYIQEESPFSPIEHLARTSSERLVSWVEVASNVWGVCLARSRFW
jgi:1,4-alpha-glucan branching enzyme/maltooligosyltrehalose trehalohydrolase